MLRRRGLASQRTRRQAYVGPVEADAASRSTPCKCSRRAY